MNRLLYRLDGAKRDFSAHRENLFISVLASLDGKKFKDAESLIRFHDALLFFRAYPPTAKILKQVEAILKTFAYRVAQLRAADADLSPLDDPEVSGITGTSVTSNFSYAIVRWLAAEYPAQLSIDWDWFEEEERFGARMARFLPLLEEEAMVEAHVPYGDYLRAAKGRTSEVVWLVQRFEALNLPPKEKAEAYDALKIHVRWQFGVRASRTTMKLATRKIFFHDQPLIARREVSLIAELTGPSLRVEKVSAKLGEKILEMARETSAVRYRELHGFTFGDPRRVLKANLGRGVEVFIFGVPPPHRLPLRGYHAALIFKNGVPVGYFEGLSIFERMESGFNLYYTFREGETAWLYARVLRLMRQLLGVTVFSIDPYQVGHENEEGIESGAFWFYRKLGFRPVRRDLMKLTLAEEHRLAADSSRRTTARTLRKLASGHMLFEMPEAAVSARKGDWDRFQVRHLGLAIQKQMGGKFGGDAQKIREHSVGSVASALDLRIRDLPEGERLVLEDFALLLALMPIEGWDAGERHAVVRIIQAKARGDESLYLRLMQQHLRLRAAVIRLGS